VSLASVDEFMMAVSHGAASRERIARSQNHTINVGAFPTTARDERKAEREQKHGPGTVALGARNKLTMSVNDTKARHTGANDYSGKRGCKLGNPCGMNASTRPESRT
jgi:hypothetical protein